MVSIQLQLQLLNIFIVEYLFSINEIFSNNFLRVLGLKRLKTLYDNVRPWMLCMKDE